VLVSTFLINHFDLFGLRQVWMYLRRRPYTPLPFRTPGPYQLVRHPLYVGWLFAFWSTPAMTSTHLLFAAMTTAYILIAIRFEERDLVAAHPEYAGYRERVPMLIPASRRNGMETDAAGIAVVRAVPAPSSKVKMLVLALATLPGKVACSCPQTGSLGRAVGYLNSFVNDHGSYTTVDVWCVYQSFLLSGEPGFTTACADYRLLK
jgi:hypothetical protein